jgi:septal ring factor EnvC (AmiA/AmiB activator)
MAREKRKTTREAARSDKDYLRYHSYIIEHTEKLCGKLKGALRILPKVDDAGHSECSCAESLFAKKNEAREKLAKELPELRACLNAIKKEIRRAHSNAERVVSGASRLNHDDAKAKYDTAENGARAYEKKMRQKKDRILKVIKKAEALLKKAREKTWPLGEPKRRRVAPARSGPTYGPLAAGQRDNLDGLLSLGPRAGAANDG